MPSSATITSFYSFTALTRIKSAEVNANFSNYRGHIIPISPTTATGSTLSYDLGSTEYIWNSLYARHLLMYGDTTASTPPAGFYNLYVKSTDGKAYKKDSAGLESQLGGGALVVTNTPAAPGTITAAGGITFTFSNGERQLMFLIGDTTTGTDITANPQINATTTTAYNLELWLMGTDNTRPIILDDGTGLTLNGQMTLNNNSLLKLLWNGSTWIETGRMA
jgi:hypothetical protein